MIYISIEIDLKEVERTSTIPAIEAMNKYMLSLSNDFPLKEFFSEQTIKEVVNFDPIFVIHSSQNSKYECISGIRAISTLHAYGVTSHPVNLVERISIPDAVLLAIRNNVLPLVYWPVAQSNKVRCFKLIKELRKCLPSEYKKLIPSLPKLKRKIDLNNFEGRRSFNKKSDLEILIDSICVKRES